MSAGTGASEIAQAWEAEITRQRSIVDGSKGFALIDCGLMSKADLTWLDAQRASNLFVGTPDEQHAQLGPRLLALPEVQQGAPGWLNRLAMIEAREPCVHWLWTPEDERGLIQRLQSLFIGKLENGRSAMIRYFDRAVWQFLAGHLNEVQKARFFGPARAWQTWSVGGWVTHPGQALAEPLDLSEPLLWTDPQVYRINLAGLPMQLFDDLQPDYPDQLDASNRRDMEQRFAKAVEKADAWGIVTYRDFMLFTILSFTVAPEFDQHPEVAAQLKRIRADGVKLYDIVDDVPRSAWADLGAPARSDMY
jgi:hypothetical protein